jgi:capsular exopolysaccharide synthesis family protein
MPQKEVHLRDYLEILRTHDFIICLSILLLLGAAVVVSLRLPRTYSASALVLLVQPTSRPPISSTSLFQSVLSGGVDRSEMETIGQRFSTESMLASAIDSLEDDGIKGAIYLPPIGQLQRNLKAKIRPDTHYIEVSLDLREAEGGERNAALLTNQLIREFQLLRSREETHKAKYRLQLLDGKIAEFYEQIQAKEAEAIQFALEAGNPATWYPQLSSLLDQHVRLLDQEAQVERNIKVTQLELNRLEEEVANYPEDIKISEIISHHPIWRSYHEKLISLEQYRVGRQEQVGDDSLDMRSMDAEIEELKKKLDNFETDLDTTSKTYGEFPRYISLRNQLMALQTAILRGENNLNQIKWQSEKANRELRQLINSIPENEFYRSKLEKEIDGLYELRKEIYKQRLEAEILVAESNYWSDGSIHGRGKGGIEVIDPAVPRKIPVRPRISFIVIIAGGIGGAVGISIALLMEYFGKTYKQPEEVQSDLGLFYLGTVKPETQDAFSQSISDSYRTIAANIDLSNPEIDKCILMLTSCDFSEDVSSVTANLGATMASVKDSVLIADCNLSHPTQHQIFNTPSDSGQTNLLVDGQMDWDQAIQHTHIPNLDLLRADALSSNPIDFLRFPRLNGFFQQLRDRYDLILLNAPPILPTADSLILSVHSDAVILIVDLDYTHRETLRASRNRMMHTQIPLLGFIHLSFA